ncbi:box C/D snoRNA protein 1 [Prorops nasuta]|uniref:box C/D snoRNA protein 1 n=1 Tax=Prorops nasuta TaxID=863751 RepID=UPI0034CD2E4D
MATPIAEAKLENCEVCVKSKAKYTCPKCEVRTCSITCVNIHKKELECDGVRDRTKYVPIKSYTDLDLLSDYRLLEEVGRTVERLQRDPSRKCTRRNNLPGFLYKLKMAANQRNIDLRLMPQNFTKHKENSTFYKRNTNEIFWRIEWIFPQAEHIKWITERALETIRLSNLLEEIWDSTKSLPSNCAIEELNLKLSLSEKLQYYKSAGICGLKVLLKAENIEKSDYRFHELDPTETLTENLANKTIIEFPTIYVVLKDHAQCYEIVECDDRLENSSLSKVNSNTFQKGKEKKFKKEKAQKSINFFFDTELIESDEEEKYKFKPHTHCTKLNIPNYNDLVKMDH